ncbi:MAG: aspartyl protease family protein [Prolixibacteraceae bacterium]|nr:aspartyl protease family protein [Prolixibacteraceae bacterium]
MNPERFAYCTLFSSLMAAVAVLLSSFSPRFISSGTPEIDLIPVYTSISNLHSDYYTPEFDLNADSVIIPMKRAGRLFLIEAKVDGETGNLVFDTGANGLVLNSTYFRSHVKTGGSSSNGITGAVGTIEQISIGQIEFSDLTYKNLRADLANLGHIENRRGVKILGLIGFGMIRNLEIVIDPINSELKLFRIDKTGKRLNTKTSGFIPDYSQKIEGNSNILFLKATIGGKLLNFCFDTGAETNAISSDANKKIMSTVTITRRATLKGAGAAGAEVLFGRMNDFTIGNRQLPNMETIITNLDALSEAYGTHIDGMLGNSFINHGIVSVNFVNKQFGIRFTKGEEK